MPDPPTQQHIGVTKVTRTRHAHRQVWPVECGQPPRTCPACTQPQMALPSQRSRRSARHCALANTHARAPRRHARARGAADGEGAAPDRRQAAAGSSTAQLQDANLARALRGAASLRKCDLRTDRGAFGLADRMRRQRRSGGSRRRRRGCTVPHARGPSIARLCAPLQQERAVADAQNGQQDGGECGREVR